MKTNKPKSKPAMVKCGNCDTEWDLAKATSSRCPNCRWITEIYFKRGEALNVARIYNEHEPTLPKEERAAVTRLIGLDGYAVVFKDQERLFEVADEILASGRQ
jgi:hypothetical protein